MSLGARGHFSSLLSQQGSGSPLERASGCPVLTVSDEVLLEEEEVEVEEEEEVEKEEEDEDRISSSQAPSPHPSLYIP